MARGSKAGWYDAENGGRRFWDGNAWTSQYVPALPPEGTPRGWYPDSDSTRRWWNGSSWTDARIADDGTFDVAEGIGQKIVKAIVSGGLDQSVELALLRELRGYPPGRITQIQVYFTTFGIPATNALAVVEWEHPR